MESTSHFNDIANNFDTPATITRGQAFADAIRSEVAVPAGARILDFGCGTGLLSAAFLPEAARILGLDTSDGMLEVFRRKAAGDARVELQNVDIESPDFRPGGSFDLIMSSMAFHHLDAPERVLAIMAGILAPDGTVAIIDLATEDGSFHAQTNNMGVKHFGFGQTDLERWAAATGLRLVRSREIYAMEKSGRRYPIFLAVFQR